MDQGEVETYLRCRAEDALLSQAGLADLRAHVQAALAIGAVDDGTARAVLADFRRAWAVRTGEMVDDVPDGTGHRTSEPSRTVACPTIIEQPWGRLLITHVTFRGPDGSEVGVLGWVTAPSAPAVPAAVSAHPHRMRHVQDWPDSLDIVDDRGRTHASHFHGGSSDGEFDGGYTVHPPFDDATTAITVLGHRIDLTAAPPVAVRIESVAGRPPADLARRHLDVLAGSGHRPWGDGGVAVAARTFADLGLPDVVPVEGEDADDDRAAIFRRRAMRQQSRTPPGVLQWIPVGAVAGPVDGCTISVPTLRRDAGVVTISYACTGDWSEGPEPQLRATAIDDLGGTYRLPPRSSSGGGGSWSVTAELEPALDPAARTLTVEFDTPTHVVHVDVPLDWQDG